MIKPPNIYIKIFSALQDQKWHNKAEFCRAWSDDRRRLNEMRQRLWIDYEEREFSVNGEVKYTEYRINAIYPLWWEYAKKFGIFKQEGKQLTWV